MFSVMWSNATDSSCAMSAVLTQAWTTCKMRASPLQMWNFRWKEVWNTVGRDQIQRRAAKEWWNSRLLLKRNMLLKLRETKTRPIITTCAFIYALTKPMNAIQGSCFTVILWLQTVLSIIHKPAVSSSCSRLTHRYCCVLDIPFSLAATVCTDI